MVQGAMGIGMLVRRQVMPRWENYPVRLYDGSRQESGQERLRAPPIRKSGGGRKRADRFKNIGVAYVKINNIA